MIRARFRVYAGDPRPIKWPIKHPYWISGEGDDYYILVAYADNGEEILANWPEANDVDAVEVEDYAFTDRFPKPDWFMPGAVQYVVDPEQDELRRPGFAAVLAQVQAERPTMSADNQRALAKERWHAQQEKDA